MQMIMCLALRVDAAAPDAEQTWLFEGDVPFVPPEGSDVVVLDDIPEGVRVKRVRHLRTQQAYEVILDEMDLDEAGIPDEQSYALLEAGGWRRFDQPEQSDDARPPERAVTLNMARDLTAQQAARELGVTDRRIGQLCMSGTLDAVKDHNDHWRIDANSVRKYLRGLALAPNDGRRRTVVFTDEGTKSTPRASRAELQRQADDHTVLQLLAQQQVQTTNLAGRVDRILELLKEDSAQTP